jgi:agmatinase
MSFDPSAAAAPGSGVFGLPYREDESRLVILPVPWDATTSYRPGSARGPAAILEASRQVDLYDLDVERPYEAGIHMRPLPRDVEAESARARADAERVIAVGGAIGDDGELGAALQRVNAAGAALNDRVRAEVESVLAAGRIAAVLGGDHSVPLGAFEAVAARHGRFGILHFDAHSDTRDAFEGFEFSHASIMYNALVRIPEVTRLTQVAIRDVCEQEIDFCRGQGERVRAFSDGAIARRLLEGDSFQSVCRTIVATLPQDVWISFDIDGLDPRLCPSTGTPVPGGLDFHQATYLVGEVVRSGRTVLGFDLSEVAPAPDAWNDWDANVGARLLYKLCGYTLASRGLARLMPR